MHHMQSRLKKRCIYIFVCLGNKQICAGTCMTNNLSQYCPSRSHRKLMAWCCFFVFFCKHATTTSTGHLPRGQWQMKSFIRSIHEPPFRHGCDQQSSTSSEQVLPAGRDRNIQIVLSFAVMIAVCEALTAERSAPANRCGTDFGLFPQTMSSTCFIVWGFFYLFSFIFLTRQLITSNLTSVRRDWTITCVCGILQLPRAR